MPSFSKPTDEQVNAAVPWLSAPHHERYFFDKLDNPHWIEPLLNRGFFKDAPEPETVEGGGVRCRVWPQSRYLARMAPLAPCEVTEVLVGIKTSNWIVIRDMIDAFKGMPSAHAVMLVETIGDAVRDFRLWHELDDIAEIAARLSREGFADAAVDLVARAFSITRDEVERRRRQDDYGFIEGLGTAIPALVPAKPREMITLLINWLVAAIESKSASSAGEDDLSYVWRPAIEDHEQNRDFDFAAKLVGSLRDAIELAIRDHHLTLSGALQLIDQGNLGILKRLRVHLIAEFADSNQNLARSTMMDKALFIDHRVKHEYARLVRLRFTLLPQDEQNKWLSWVDAGPEAYWPDYFDAEADAALRMRQADYWRFRRLYWVRDHLTGERKHFYERMVQEHGQPQLSDLNVYSSGVRWGHETPLTHEQLAEMGFEAAVSAVSKWRPDPDQSRFDRPSIEGLSGAFAQYVKSDPVAYSVKAHHLKGTPAPYVRAFLRTMEEAVKEGQPIELESVLDLCEWVLSRPVDERTSPSDEDRGLVDRDWQWCRDAIADLIEEVCKAEDDKVPRFPVEHRMQIWRVLSPLLDSPASSYVLRDDAEADPRVTDWPLLALNSPRGKAMRALFEYADWIASHLDQRRSEHRTFPGGLDQVPEVRAALEDQLEGPDDQFTGRAGFGWRLGLLYWLDSEWLRQHANQIFDLRVIEHDPSRAYGWAAWNTFLFANRPHIEFYRILRDQFDYAVRQAATIETRQDSREQPFARLAEHLITLYGRGDLGKEPETAWNADGGIIRRLVTETHVSVRSHAVEFVGMTLQDADETLPEEVAQRFMYLWERYWESVGRDDATRHPTSSVFGYWFSCDVFDPAWSIEQLEQFVSAAPKAEPDHMIMERLTKIAHVDPTRSARIVGALVDGDDENWRIWSWKDEAKEVLAVARKSGGEAKEVAEAVIDRLGRRGYQEFGDLLGSP